MKISLITFSAFAFGIRDISSYLKSNGYETRLIFFQNVSERKINKKFLENLYSIVKDSDIIGVAVECSNYFDAIKITQYLQNKLTAPVLWGGAQTVADPEACIKFADILCIGEGEEPVLELVRKMEKKEDYKNIPNLWFREESRIIKNPIAKLVTNLDKYPFPDYDISNHYIYNKKSDTFKKISHDDLIYQVFSNQFIQYQDFKVYHILTSRGCPHNCTYCGNNILRKRYKGEYVRKCSVNRLIDEIKWIRFKFPFINYISFEDDTFTGRSENEILEFSKKYKKEINLPFHISSTPLTLTEKKLEALINCGLSSIRLGVQTGSERILKHIYKRPTNNKVVLKTAYMVHKYRRSIKQMCVYDFIFDNPFETTDDQIETLKLIASIPRPYSCLYHSLSFYPGTEILDMAREAGYIKDEINQTYNKSTRSGKFNYVRFFATAYPLIPFKIPQTVAGFLVNKKTVIFLNKEGFGKIFKVMTSFIFLSFYAVKMIQRVLALNLRLHEVKLITLKIQENFLTKSTARKF